MSAAASTEKSVPPQSVSLETFFGNLNSFVEQPDGVAKLRELVLALAVRGKLVPQDSDDEPADVLLERVASDRNQMIAEKVIKKARQLAPIEPNELPFAPLAGWSFERMGNLFRFIDYRGKTPPKVDSGIRLITAKNIRMGYLKDDPREFITEETYKDWMTRGFPQVGDLLFTTEAPMGNVCEVQLTERFALAQRSINLHPFADQCSQYLVLAIRSKTVQGMIAELATGMTATGIKAAKLKLVPIPLPPLAEQKRIVAKVDQLLSQCDELEAQQQERQQVREWANRAALQRLTTASDANELSTAWGRLCDHFEVLYDTPETVENLRQSILQLAVQGKLVPQDSDDEPADVLLAEIANGSASHEVPPQEQPYAIPATWVWSPLGGVADIRMGNSPPGSSYNDSGDGEPLINGPVEFSPGPFGSTIKSKFTTEPNKMCKTGDLLICVRGSTTGRTNIAAFDACIGRGVASIRSRIHAPYLNYVILCMRELIYESGKGSTFKSISQKQLLVYPIPLPPLSEQRRIVAKVDQLLSQCDELSTQLQERQSTTQSLLSATIHRLLEAA